MLCVPWITIDHSSKLYYVWLWVVSAAFLYNLIFIPLRASFVDFNLQHVQTWLILDYLFADVIYIVDMFVKARTRFYENGVQIKHFFAIQKAYLNSTMFIFDLISILPTDVAFSAIDYVYIIIRFNRVLRYKRLFELIIHVELNATYPFVFRLAKIVSFYLIFIHYIAIIYNSLSKAFGYAQPDENDAFFLPISIAEQPFITRFASCYYWATITAGTYFLLAKPKRVCERIILVAIWLLGYAVVIFVIVSFRRIIDDVTFAEDVYKSKLEAIYSYLNYNRVPLPMIDRIVNWCHTAYRDNSSMNINDKGIRYLPMKLKIDLAMDLHLTTLKRVPLFQGVGKNVLKELVVRFKLQLFCPGEYICRKGDVGREMYIVREGCFEVFHEDGGKAIATLSSGSVFGEISLLDIPGSKLGNRRTATVRSKGYSTVLVLSKDDMNDVVQGYPDVLLRLISKAMKILRSQNIHEEEVAKWNLERDAAFNKRAKALERGIKKTEHLIALLISSISRSHQAATERLDSIERILFPPNKIAASSTLKPEGKPGALVFSTC